MGILIKANRTDSQRFYILYVTEQTCTQDTQQLSFKQRPMLTGQQRKKTDIKVSETVTQQHVVHFYLH